MDRRTILLLGSGRSGTTWLAGLLSGAFRYRLLFEPFQPHQVPGSEIIADRYYPPERIPPEVSSFCFKALDDRIDSEWIACNSCRRFRMHRWRFWPRVRVCKSVRTNLLIPAYRAMFGDELPIVVLMRHPGAVVESFLRVAFPWSSDLSVLLEPQQRDQLETTYDLPLTRLMRHTETRTGALVLRWLVENAWLSQRLQEWGVKLVFYEQLLSGPQAVVDLCRDLGIDPPPDLEQRFQRPAWTTHPRSPIRSDRYSLPDWRQRLATEDVERIESMLELAQFEYPLPGNRTVHTLAAD